MTSDLERDREPSALEEKIVLQSPAVGNRIDDLQTERWIKMMTMLVVGGPLLFVLLAIYALIDHNDGVERDRLIRQGISCLLANMDDHRITNKYAHDELARFGGKVIDQTDHILLSQDEVDRLRMDCQTFVRVTLGSGAVPPGHQADRSHQPHGDQRHGE